MLIGRIFAALVIASTFQFNTSISVAQFGTDNANRQAVIEKEQQSVEKGRLPDDNGDVPASFSPSGDPVVGRYVFYDNSMFDVIADEAAIAPDKVALKDGETAELKNYTSYIQGINGIFIDVVGLANPATLADFQFKTGNDDFPDQWAVAPSPTFAFLGGAGPNGADRIKLTWPNGTIKKTWLQIRLRANTNTGLFKDDIFYFGNVPGEAGNNLSDSIVNLIDVAETRAHQSGFNPATISNKFDYDRDNIVGLPDVALARQNQSGFFPVKLIRPWTEKAISAELGRGVNFGNMLEAPNEGDWGFFVQEIFFDKVVEAGLDHIRLPISWTNHATVAPPYTIDPAFFARVDWCIAQAKFRGLKIIVNVHHYDELNANPAAEWNRALGIWSQIATRYRNEPSSVFFEILNEPHGAFNTNPATWNLFMIDALNVIRATNPTRKVLVGPTFWNSISALGTFFPPNDPNLITTVHYYDPFLFTHQGATWVSPVPPVGRPWYGTVIGFSDRWQNWGWNTTTTPTNNGMEVTYTAGWAGIRFHSNTAVSGTHQLVFTTNGPAKLQFWLANSGGTESTRVVLQTGSGVNTYTINISQFAGVTSFSDVYMQNFSPNPATMFVLKDIQLCGINANSSLIETESETLKNSFRAAAKWSLANNIPLHLGEFGAYSLADMPSRVRWTTAVRSTCEQLNINWAYWELAAGFGFYNPANNTWRTELLQALNPDYGN